MLGMSPQYMAQLRLLTRMNNRFAPGQRHTPSLPLIANMVARQRRAEPPSQGQAVGWVATQRVGARSVPGGRNVKAHQAWKYNNFEVQRAPLEINGRYYSDPTDPEGGGASTQAQPVASGETLTGSGRRKQESNFFITINANQMYHGPLIPRAQQQYKKALESLSLLIPRYIKFGPSDNHHGAHYRSDFYKDVILPDAEWKSTVEVGEVKGRMHCHIILGIEHYSQIQINVNTLKNEFKSAFNSDLNMQDRLYLKVIPYVQVKMLPQGEWSTIMSQYIRKGMEG